MKLLKVVLRSLQGPRVHACLKMLGEACNETKGGVLVSYQI